MKSAILVSSYQTLMAENNNSSSVGLINFIRLTNSNSLVYSYANGAEVVAPGYTNFFQNLDNEWIYIVAVCDYANKTLKVYRNGTQFGTTTNLVGTPLFPSTNRIKYIGAYSAGAGRINNGYLDDVWILNRLLLASEISQIYNQTKGKYQ